MPTGTQSQRETDASTDSQESPMVSLCETSPGKSVFIESGNTDGWIAIDTTLDVIQ